MVSALVLTQCNSLRDWVWGGPPCHQLKPREETMSVTFPTSFNRACFACSAPSSDPGTERRIQERQGFQVVVQLRVMSSGRVGWCVSCLSVVRLIWGFRGFPSDGNFSRNIFGHPSFRRAPSQGQGFIYPVKRLLTLVLLLLHESP